MLVDTAQARTDAGPDMQVREVVGAASFRVPMVGDDLFAVVILEGVLVRFRRDLPEPILPLCLFDAIGELARKP